MASRVPFDDRTLELEEVEGLVKAPTKRQQPKKTENSSSSSRWAIFMLTVGIMLGVLLTSDSESLRFWEGNAGENVDDVEQKNTTTSAPTPEPTAVAPTPPPTIKETPPPTPPPTDAATPPPTEAAVTLPPTDAAITPPPVDTAVTPPPTIKVNAESADPDKTGTPLTEGKAAVVDTKALAADDFGPARYTKPSLVVKPDPPLTPERSEALAKEWGKWQFVDKKADQRPKDDFAAAFPYRDVPRDKFPANAWQTDPEYLKDFLDEGIKLVDRSMEAILAEYGHGKKDDPDKDFDVRMKEMFEFKILDKGVKVKGKGLIPEAGWTNEESFQGLVRRVLHALMTNDNFTLVVGGHSAAAGHGNHFKQSYGMQFHKIMEPIMSLLGVKVLSRNIAQGGLGTIQHSLGFKDLYGDSIDIMVWDSGMTESRDHPALDVFWRQAIISGDRVPFLLGAGSVDDLTGFSLNADADIGNFGEAMPGLPECTSEAQCDKFPYATRYMKCSSEMISICALHKWNSNCWVDRSDVTPAVKQNDNPESQVKWHPGFRAHQLNGRIINMFVLKALKEGLTKWQQTADYALPDTEWHVTAHYDNIRTKLAAFVKPETPCFTQPDWPKRMCTTPMRVYAEYSPRANPEKTSITSIIKPGINGFVPHIKTGLLYTGPDVFNPVTAIPEGEIDVLAIVSNGRTYVDDGERRRLDSDEIITGLGIEVGNLAPGGYCDGTYNSECRRAGNCLLSGQGDSRACLMFDSYSGWIVMNLPAVQEGIITLAIQTWRFFGDNSATKGWTSINNMGRRNLRAVDDSQNNVTALYDFTEYDFEQEERRLRRKQVQPDYCDNFKFEFAINGKVTVWDKDSFKEKSKNPQRAIEIQTVLDDPDFTKEPIDVELAIRMTGCGDTTHKTFCLSHVYFA